MSGFNGSGTFTNASAPFTPNTVISSTAMNDNFSVIAVDGLSQVICKDGQTTITGALKGASGSVGLPAYSFSADLDCGMYRKAVNELAFSTAGTLAGHFDASQKFWAAGALNAAGAVTLATTLAVTGDVAVNTNKFTVTASSGNTLVAGTLSATGDVAVNTNKFNVTASSGNTAIAGTLAVTGTATVGGNAVMTTGTSLVNANYLPGSTVGFSSAEYTTAATIATPFIPYDDTIPTSSEGTEILSVTHTPLSATNKVRVQVSGFGACNGSDVATVAIFDGSTCKSARSFTATANEPLEMEADCVYTPGDTAAHTITVRIGPASTNLYPNGISTGRKLGGAARWVLTVTELKA